MISTLVEQRDRATRWASAVIHFVRTPDSARSLKHLALRGTVWTLLGYGTGQLLRLGGNVVLTRLLYPELFGFMALTNVFVNALYLFSDLGIGTSIVQNARGLEPSFLNTTWTLQVGRGFVLWLASFLIAIPLAQFYGDPRLQTVIPVVAFGAVIGGFNSTDWYILQRELKVRARTMLDLASQILSLLVMVVWAWLAPGVWALVAGGIVAAVVKLVGSHWLRVGPRNRLAWDRSALVQLLHFGKWIFLATAVMFLGEQVDRLALGKLVTLELLGVYGIAMTFADVPRQVTLAISSQVLFPAISKLRDVPRPALREKILRHRGAVLVGLAGGLALLAGFGDVLIHSLYDSRYWQAAWMLPLLAIGVWPRMLCNTLEPSLTAIGMPKYTAVAQLVRFAFTLFGILLGLYWFGIFGAVIAVALNDVAYYAVIHFGLWRQGLDGLKQDFLATLALAAFTAFLLLGRAFFGIPFHV